MSIFKGAYGPWLIAEIGGNHEGDFDQALRLTDLAIESGADAIKFQIYFGDTLVSSIESPDRNAHFKRFELAIEQHQILAARVRAAGKTYLASVWDLSAFEWVDPWSSAYKVGSGDLTALPFLRAAASTGKPLIVSTGLSDLAEVVAAVEFIRSCNPVYHDPDQLALLQCTSMYPIPAAEAHLSVIGSLSSLGVTVGYSDHCLGRRALEVAAAMGAQVLEFHFTDQKNDRSFRDHQLSLDKDDVRELLQALSEIKELKGSPIKTPTAVELDNDHPRSFRRGVYPARDIAAGELLDESNLCVLRPNHGIDARDFYAVTGRRARRALARHAKLDWSDIE